MLSAAFLIALFSFLLLRVGSTQLFSDDCLVYNDRENHNAPWLAQIHNDSRLICAGTLIHNRFVLTSAFCIETQQDLFVSFGLTEPKQYMVRSAYIHHLYSNITFANDIGLLELQESVVFRTHLRRICISLNLNSNFQKFSTTVWGYGKRGLMIQKYGIHRTEQSNCNAMNANIQGSQICTSVTNENHTINLSGVPLWKNLKYGNESYYVQYGIYSFGFSKSTNLYVFTDVRSHLDWIAQIVLAFQVGTP